MKKRDAFEIAIWFCIGLITVSVFFPLPGFAQEKSETVQQMEIMRDIVQAQSKSIEALAGALKTAVERPPVIMGGFQPPPVQVVEEKPCEDSLIGCALRGFGSILLKAGSKGIDFLDRNAVPLLQVVGSDRAARRQAEAAIETRRYDYMERRDVAQANAATNQALGLNLQNVAQSGFGTVAGMPTATTYNVSGTGINFGSGTLNYNPVTGSYNPVNPNARVCQATTTGLICY